MSKIRQLKVAAQIFRLLNEILITEEVLFETFSNLLIVDVKMTDGLKEAKVYFTTTNSSNANYNRILQDFHSFFRSKIASNLQLKVTPRLIFEKVKQS